MARNSPIRSDAQVTERVGHFVRLVVEGYKPNEAAARAGFSDPETAGSVLIRDPTVRKALADTAKAVLEAELVPLALQVAGDLLRDTDPKAKAVRAKLALGILDRAGKNAQAEADPAQALAQMTTEQLAALVARGVQAERQEAATINVTPVVGRNDSLVR